MRIAGIQSNRALILLLEQLFPLFHVEKYGSSTRTEFSASVVTEYFIQIEYYICIVILHGLCRIKMLNVFVERCAELL